MKHLSVLAVALALMLSVSTNAFAKTESHVADPGAAVVDAILVRPLMLGVSLISTAFYLVTVPVTFLTDTDEEAGDVFLHCPWWYTSGRNLGDFDQPRP